MADSQGLAVIVEVLEGKNRFEVLQDGRAPGTIHMVGRLGPFRPVKYSGKQRVKTTFYPGNPVGTQQVFGPTLDPTTFNGYWRDRYLGDGAAMGMVALFEDLRIRGASLRVSWGGTFASSGSAGTVVAGRPIVRVGMITSFEFAPAETVGDVGWTITMDWRSDGTVAAPVVAATGLISATDDLTAASSDLDLASATWQAAKDGSLARLTGIPQRLSDGMDQAFSATTTAADAIRDVSARATSATLAPPIAAGQLIGAATGAIDALASATSLLLSMNLLAIEVRDDAVDALRLRDQNFILLETFDRASLRCADAATAAQERVEPEVIAEVRAPAGTDLRDLALRFYGDPDAWNLIAAYNNLDGSAIPSPPSGPSDVADGATILIPRQTSSSAGDVRQAC